MAGIIPPDMMPYVAMGAGVVIIFVGWVWLQDELDMPNKGTWFVYDMVTTGRPYAFWLLWIMAFGVGLVVVGWKSLP